MDIGVKQPYYIQRDDAGILLFAGLWSKVDGQVTFTILTKQADENLSHLHHRSPVMVDCEQAQDWFTADSAGAMEIVGGSTTRGLNFHPVSPDVGKVANDHEGLIDKIDPETPLQETATLF